MANTDFQSKRRNIPLVFLNARITKRLLKMRKLNLFTKSVQQICLHLTQNKNKHTLKKLGAKKIKNLGNLKFSAST